ncbi:MAG: glutamate-5-semialdehyde dehydrogenase [Myxococcales bacterium]|nr:glutamate-5-semialdehyde dehydrogenase [Myxococcales bacterium]
MHPNDGVALLDEIGRRARAAARILPTLSSETKDRCLRRIADKLLAEHDGIAEANERDLAAARDAGLTGAMVDRLRLTSARVASMADGLRQVAALPDPIGEITETWRRPNGLTVQKARIPLGVIGIIYEARPNVTVDAAGLCFKSGNAVILRGGSEAFESNRHLVELLRGELAAGGVTADAVQFVPTADRESVAQMLTMSGVIDLMIPRGGEGLIRYVTENARMPVIQHFKGTCHVFVDEDADADKATAIALNAKVQRPGVCNAMETLLVHRAHASTLLPALLDALASAGVEIRGCSQTRDAFPAAKAATEEDWSAEYLDLILSVRVVDSLDEAIAHIQRYGSDHTEAIVTENYTRAREFVRRIDSSVVMVNASTRFSDGNQLGLGAEIGISTTRLHAYGPMGLRELTSQKFVIYGDGQIRA